MSMQPVYDQQKPSGSRCSEREVTARYNTVIFWGILFDFAAQSIDKPPTPA